LPWSTSLLYCLQLKAVGGLRTADRASAPPRQGRRALDLLALYVALVLAGVLMVFGARHLDATERHSEGMVAAIAFGRWSSWQPSRRWACSWSACSTA
jgi:hypothetical protein